jgi:hypothetical protein
MVNCLVPNQLTDNQKAIDTEMKNLAKNYGTTFFWNMVFNFTISMYIWVIMVN